MRKQQAQAARELAELREKLNCPKHFSGECQGYGLRGTGEYGNDAIVAKVPSKPGDAQESVCGVKGFLIDSQMRYQDEEVDLTCPNAVVAVLWIKDSPVHVHGHVKEIYHVLTGRGQMVLGNRVVDVCRGSVIFIPPGVCHGLVSTGRRKVKVLLVFMPGLAPKEFPQHRDERIVCDTTSFRIRELQE